MKRICPRGGGKIHSSPSCAGGGSGRDAAAALNLLPAAILALTAALGAEDREVLAYLVARSLQWPWPAAAAAEEEKAGRRRRRRQLPSYCGCFECYTGYWFRWDSSPDRELIHRAIEGFEEHLASSEGRRRGGRRRHRRLGDRAERVTETAAEGPAGEKSSSSSSSEDDAAEERDQLMAAVEVEEGSGGMNVAAAAAANYQHSAARGRRWRGVMGLFTSTLWSLWLPGV
ncbi:unnamed protein product [Spirodela intermedia]|uniref:Uncharacterized protein n=1 Tax=Spirodela intermedia TaxID=51605 RepID=A0A7I8L635_SPIIN|nr:unnamed protein product [Spirodela intermedia]